MNPYRKKEDSLDIRKIAEEQLAENMEVIKSLRDYDEGKKNIQTTNIEKRLPYIQTTR